MKVAFVIRRNCPRCAKIVNRIIEIAPSDWELVFEHEISKYIKMKTVSIEEINADIIITVGGDGTVLWTLQYARGSILGINMGGLGFLSEIEIGEVEGSVYRLMRGDYVIDSYPKLKVVLDGERLKDATNEVLIHSDRIAKIRKFSIFAGDNFVDRVASDGVIVATAVGSTSYSYSAGGPVLFPTLNAAVISYLAPFASRSRSIVIPSEEEIRVKLVGSDQGCKVIIDGQTEYSMDSSDDLRISRSENKADFVTMRRSFYDRVREKLVKNVVN
ncbi:MAG: NAD(+) kinase [Candidatus Thermoplasmatota archaeon]|nr:NAD(+) kinase [Candidatus Thermoplasmatota archaeon]MCL5665346.1 NAD(+) kinase [Candidatus Thermoplasmatota archaeon]